MGLEKYSLNFPPFFLTGRSSAYSRSPAGLSLCSGRRELPGQLPVQLGGPGPRRSRTAQRLPPGRDSPPGYAGRAGGTGGPDRPTRSPCGCGPPRRLQRPSPPPGSASAGPGFPWRGTSRFQEEKRGVLLIKASSFSPEEPILEQMRAAAKAASRSQGRAAYRDRACSPSRPSRRAVPWNPAATRSTAALAPSGTATRPPPSSISIRQTRVSSCPGSRRVPDSS